MPSKYFSEAMLGLCSQGTLILRPVDLKNDHNQFLRDNPLSRDCHIYAICKRAKISLKPEILTTDDNFVYGMIDFHIKGERWSEPFRLTKQIFQPYCESFVVSDYPHNNILALSASGELVHTIPLSLFSQELDFQTNVRDYLDLEILYIGQAYGNKGKRNALDRLKSHSTLQNIQADLLSHDPDSDILLLLVEYAAPRLTTLFNPFNPQISGQEDDDHLKAIMTKKYIESRLVTLAEAGLIRYFNPPYNLVYANSFPSTNMKSLDECYELDILALSVGIDTEILGLNIYSKQVARHYHHLVVYSLHPTDERTNYFLGKEVPSLLER